MLTKASYIQDSEKQPFTVATIEGLGEVGLILFRDGQLAELKELERLAQIANIIRDNKGERVFSDEDIKVHIGEKMPPVVRDRVVQKTLEVNGLKIVQEEVKKN